MSKNDYKVYIHITPNGKYYVGITSKLKVEDRWGKGHGYRGQYFYEAIEEFGWNNIEHKVLIHGLTKEQAERWEQKLIKHYKSNDDKFGYNKTEGGDILYYINGVDIVCLNDGKYFNSIASASEFYGVNSANISKVCTGIDPHIKKLVFRYQKDYNQLTKQDIDNILNTPMRLGKIRVICLDNNTIYESALEAGKQLNINESGITRCCNGTYRAIKGCHFMYEEDFYNATNEQILFILNNDKKTSSVKVICLETSEIFDSLKSAGEKYNTTGANIGMCCSGVNKTACNLHWMYYKDYFNSTPEEIQNKLNS